MNEVTDRIFIYYFKTLIKLACVNWGNTYTCWIESSRNSCIYM